MDFKKEINSGSSVINIILKAAWQGWAICISILWKNQLIHLILAETKRLNE